MDDDPLFIRNPDPDMSGDDPLFVVNPKYLSPQSASQFQQPMPMYHETVQRSLPQSPGARPSTYTMPGQVVQDQGALQTDWMSVIPDDAPLAALSVPGTHKSMLRTGGPSIQRQTWDIATQLNYGIRYMDIDLCLTANGIVFKGDPQQPFISIDQFMTPVAAFLTEHPKEVILVRITDACAGGLDFYIRLHQTLNERYANYIFPLQIPNVKLGMARGKIVIVKNYYGGPPGGVEFRELDTSRKMALASPDQKDLKPMTKEIKRHLKKVIRSGNFDKMFLTRTNAKGPGFIFQYAAAINEVLGFFLHKNPKGRVGIVGMDFPPQHVINDIIMRNFKRGK